MYIKIQQTLNMAVTDKNAAMITIPALGFK